MKEPSTSPDNDAADIAVLAIMRNLINVYENIDVLGRISKNERDEACFMFAVPTWTRDHPTRRV